MKQNDIALLILLVIISAFGSVLIGNQFIRPSKNKTESVEVVEKLDPQFPAPDPTVFNDTALNPTREITIGNSTSPQPIKSQ